MRLMGNASLSGGVIALLAGFVLSIGALGAHAGTPLLNYHEFDLKGKVLFQDMKNLDLKTGKDSFNARESGAACLGVEQLEKSQKVILCVQCVEGEVGGAEAEIWVVDTDPIQFQQMIGTVDLDLENAIGATKQDGEELKTITALGKVDIDCDDLDASVEGVFEVKYGDVAGQQCPTTLSGKNLSGDADDGSEIVILNGVRASAKKPSVSLAPLP